MISKLFYLPFFLIFYKYEYFIITALIFGLLFITNLCEVKINRFFLKISFLSFLIARLISGFNLNISNIWFNLSQMNYSLAGRFIDMQSVFWSLNCNSEIIGQYSMYGSEQILNCPYNISYGPLFELISIKNNALFSTFLITTVAFLLIYLYFIDSLSKYDNKNSYIFTLCMFSPPVNFILERMNFDIIIYITIFITYTKIKNHYIKNFIFFLLAMLKYYPIFLILGNLIFKLVKRQKSEILPDILGIILFSLYLSYYSFHNSILNQPVRPFRSDRTFGILSDSLNISNIFKTDYKLNYIFLVLIILLTILFIMKEFKYSNLFENNKNHNLIFMFISLSLFANYDYRLAFLILIYSSISKAVNKHIFISYYIFIFSSPSLMHAYGSNFQLIENYNLIFIDIVFYFFISNLILEYIFFIKTNKNISQNQT